MKYYEFIFYKFYKFMLKIGSQDIPALKANVFFSMWLGFFLSSAISIPYMTHLTDKELNVPKAFTVISFLLICILNHLYFIKNKRYATIKKKFESTERLSFFEGSAIMFIFLFLPFAELLFVLANIFIFKEKV